MSFGSQLVTLTWKNSLLKRRHLVSFCFELWLPVLLVFGFTGLSTLFDTYEVPSGWSTAKFDPSAAIGQGSFDVNSKQVNRSLFAYESLASPSAKFNSTRSTISLHSSF